MKIAELIAADALKPQLDRIRKSQQALKIKKAAIKAQRAQQQLRAAKAPATPLS